MKHLRSGIFFCVIAFTAFAGDLAPVVDAGQDSRDTQVESAGGTWESMSNAEQHQESTSGEHANENAASAQAIGSDESEKAPIQEYVATGSLDQQVARLGQQVTNIAQMNLPQQIGDLRDQVAQLQGQLSDAQREIKTLTAQQQNFYQDLTQQIAQLKGGHVSATKKTRQLSAIGQPEPAVAMTAAIPAGDADAYGKAFHLLARKDYTNAQTGFQQYLQNYPKGRFAANAHFWLGEIAMTKQHYTVASQEFQTVIAQYPKSDKVSDAKLKMAMVHAAIGRTDQARHEFQQIKKIYPGSTAAQLASIRLQQLGG